MHREHPITAGRKLAFGKRGDSLTADYVLVYRNTKLAVIEAKAWDLPLTEGLAQAKNYADRMDIRFTYSTNGRGIYQVDRECGVEGEVDCYPSPEQLWAMTHAEANLWRDRFAEVPFQAVGDKFEVRYYQEIAVARVLEAIAAGRQRVLLTLATGTGKTFIAFQIAWKLFQARWNLSREPSRRPRILFLADRNILADQASNDFSAFAEDARVRIEPEEVRKKGRVPTNGSVFFTIFQTFLSGPVKDGHASPYFGEYPPDFFDFIVIDECHRGGANDESTWRGILEYFSPAVQLGLTATPKREANADTYAYFGDPVYIYSLREGINDGFLTPFQVRQISTTLDEYVYTSDDDVIEGEVEEGRVYREGDFNRTIEIEEREEHRVGLLLREMKQNEKTIIFCANQGHALLVRDLVNRLKASTDPDYCHRVTANDGKLGEQHLRNFQKNSRTIPTVLTTSQKLSTGVDARNVRNIVLMRPVRSIIEFKQIIGRGTRLYDGKDYFTVYDFVRASLNFSDPEWDGEPLPPEVPEPGPTGDGPVGDGGGETGPGHGPEPVPGSVRLKVKLADGKARSIAHMASTSFWHPDGRPMSAREFLEALYGRLPEFFKNEAELRELWSDPDTRAKLLEGLAGQGFGPEQMGEMAKILQAEKSDLFDVLAHVAYALPPLTREERASGARLKIRTAFTSKQQDFLDFVLTHYVSVGVGELEREKAVPLLKLRYGNAMADAVKELGPAAEIRAMFAGFQRYLYE